MAMSDDDNIFREVDQDMRREQLAAMWDKYGIFVLIGASLIVAIVGGYNVYQWWTEKRAAESGQAYYAASQLFNQKKTPEALAAFDELAQASGSGYRTLSQLQIAAIHADQGRKPEAVALYEQIAQGGADAILRDFARLQAAALRLDEADRAEMQNRLDGLNTDTNPWRYSARELLALAAFRSGDASESEKLFSQLLADPSAPAEIRRRAEAMLALLVKAPKQLTSVTAGDEDSRKQ
jgi:hypothetical protein